MSQDQVWKPSEPGVRGPRRGPDPSQAEPENPNMTEGALTGHRYHQSFEKRERRNDSVRKKSRLQGAAGITIYNDGNGPRREPALVKYTQTGMHVCTPPPHYKRTKRWIFIHEREQDGFVRRLLMCTRQMGPNCIPTSFVSRFTSLNLKVLYYTLCQIFFF